MSSLAHVNVFVDTDQVEKAVCDVSENKIWVYNAKSEKIRPHRIKEFQLLKQKAELQQNIRVYEERYKQGIRIQNRKTILLIIDELEESLMDLDKSIYDLRISANIYSRKENESTDIYVQRQYLERKVKRLKQARRYAMLLGERKKLLEEIEQSEAKLEQLNNDLSE